MSATMGPLVARVSAAITTPPSKSAPTMVVPVLVALGSGTPWAWRAALRLWLEKSKPAMVAVSMMCRFVGVVVDYGCLCAAREKHTALCKGRRRRSDGWCCRQC